MDISSKYVSSIERGKENPTLDLLIKLAGALLVEPEELFTVTYEEPDPRKLRELATRLLREADQEHLHLAVKVLRGVLH